MDRKLIVHTLRGLMLTALNIDYPNEMSDITLLSMFQGSGYPDLLINDIRADLEYMTGKEYVVCQSRSRAMWRVKLSSKGKDLLEGNIDEDPGVRIAR